MARNSISDELIVETSARLSNEVGLENLSLKMIAEELDIKSPSLYNHISSLDDIKEKLMIYGWKQLGEYAIDSAVGVSGYDALRKCVMHSMTTLLIIKVFFKLCFGITSLKVMKWQMLQQSYLVSYIRY